MGKGTLGTCGLYRLLKPEASEPYPWGCPQWLICKGMGSRDLIQSGLSSALREEDSQCRKLKMICGHVQGIHTVSSASAYTSSPKPVRTEPSVLETVGKAEQSPRLAKGFAPSRTINGGNFDRSKQPVVANVCPHGGASVETEMGFSVCNNTEVCWWESRRRAAPFT